MPVRQKGQVPTQADKRRSMTLTDQHGRKFFAVIEKESGYPTGLVQPLFAVPDGRLVPPQKYQTFPEDMPGRMVIDYDGWLADAKAAQAEWEQNRAQLISELPGGAQSPMLPRYLGPRPIDPRLVLAMKQGNRWVLGLTDKKPPEAEQLLPSSNLVAEVPVFSETDPVMSEEPEAAAAGGVDLPAILREIKERAPAGLTGTALNNWAMKELTKLANQEA